MSTPTPTSPWYTRIGPGLITACVVIGPGSILSSSQVGAYDEYAMLWIVAASVVFMLVYMQLGATLGVVTQQSPGDIIRGKAGRWLAILVGGAVFFISSAYQSGNNLGVAAAFESFVDSKTLIAWLIVGFNAIAIAFLFAFRDLYKMLERVMMIFVGVMLVCFAVNLILLRPDPVAMLKGFIPSDGPRGFQLPHLALVGTTFVITASFYQAYLVRQKGWTEADLPTGMIDVRVGSILMALITIMLISTSAAGLYSKENPVELKSAVQVATSLEDLFGPASKIIFCLGLFSAAYSSFLVNSMIGGFMAADGLGWGCKPTDRGPRILTTVALLTGMVVALAVNALGWDATPTIIAAQAVTVLASPLVACVLLWLASSRDVMGQHVATPLQKTIAGIGLLALIAIGMKTAFVDLPKKIDTYLDPPAVAAPESLTPGDAAGGDEEASP